MCLIPLIGQERRFVARLFRRWAMQQSSYVLLDLVFDRACVVPATEENTKQRLDFPYVAQEKEEKPDCQGAEVPAPEAAYNSEQEEEGKK